MSMSLHIVTGDDPELENLLQYLDNLNASLDSKQFLLQLAAKRLELADRVTYPNAVPHEITFRVNDGNPLLARSTRNTSTQSVKP